MLIHLDLATDLAKVQPMTNDRTSITGGCRYSYPCAIGQMMTEEQRQYLVKSHNDAVPIRVLQTEAKISIPRFQQDAFTQLQKAFDNGRAEPFNKLLAEFKERYCA